MTTRERIATAKIVRLHALQAAHIIGQLQDLERKLIDTASRIMDEHNCNVRYESLPNKE